MSRIEKTNLWLTIGLLLVAAVALWVMVDSTIATIAGWRPAAVIDWIVLAASVVFFAAAGWCLRLQLASSEQSAAQWMLLPVLGCTAGRLVKPIFWPASPQPRFTSFGLGSTTCIPPARK